MKYITKFLIVVLICAVGFGVYRFEVPHAVASCGSGYSFCRTLTVDHTQAGASDSSSFTILASTTLASLKTVANGGNVNNTVSFNGQTVAADLVFSTTSDCGTLMSWDFEKYVTTTGEIEAWVLLTTLSHTSDTIFYMCYGKSSVSTYQGGSVGAAWDSNYKGVWHLPDGTTLSAKDSTSNAINGTVTGVTATTGQIDGGIAVTTSQFIDLGTTGLNFSGTPAVTFEVWAKRSTASSVGGLMTTAFPSVGGVDFSIGEAPATVNQMKMTKGGVVDIAVNGVPADTNWHHFVGVWANTGVTLYVDGAVAGTNADTQNINSNATKHSYIGQGVDSVSFIGNEDEARMSNVVRTADWITAEYNNQKSGSSMVIFGSEQNSTNKYTQITILNGRVSILNGRVTIFGN